MWEDTDFESDDPLIRFNAHQAAKGRPTVGGFFKKRWEIAEEARLEQLTVRLRVPFCRYDLVWRRGLGIVSLFPRYPDVGFAIFVIRRHGKRLDFPRRSSRRKNRSR